MKETKAIKKKKKVSFWNVLCITLFTIILFLAIGVAYLWKAQYYMNHFYDDTWINGIDCSGLEAEEAKELIKEKIEKYQLTITTNDGKHYELSGSQLQLVYTDNRGVEDLLKNQKSLWWFKRLLSNDKYEEIANISYDEAHIKATIQNMPFMDAEQMIQPQDAYIAESLDGYVIVPEVAGNALDRDCVETAVLDAILNGITELSLEESECYLKPSVFQDSAMLVSRMQGLNELTTANICYNVCSETYIVDRKILAQWMEQYENGVCYISQDKMEEFINVMADVRDSYGTAREFTTHAGEIITLTTNQYGWKVNREESLNELMLAIEEGFQGEKELVYEQKAQGKGKNDLGDVYIEISIQEQTLWCYENGQVLIETPIITGTETLKESATPRDGCWYIYRKTKDYTLKGPVQENGEPQYTQSVKYWMPFNGSIGICDVDGLAENFGGTIYLENGSYGSVTAPLDAVEKIYKAVSVGTPVIVY